MADSFFDSALQFIAVVVFISLGVLLPGSFFFILFTFPLIGISYLLWIMYFDQAPEKGGRTLPWLRKLWIWKYFNDYFSSKIILHEKLDPSKKYIFGVHPHGIIVLGVWTSFMNDRSGIQELLKGIKFKPLTLPTTFTAPFWRDFFLAAGFASVSKQSCDYLLERGYSPVIILGGKEESYDAIPGTSKLLIKRRKGFVRLALQHGASLVPVYNFGENELVNQFSNPPGSWLRKYYTFLRKRLGLSGLFFWGRGGTLIPKRSPLVTVIGSPIEVEKKEVVDEKDVDELHQKYIEGLTTLYNLYTDKYGNGAKLEFL